VAEGVGHPGQQARLLELGCDRGQGDYFAPPIPADELAAFLLRRRSS
jgi:EAL domain-containing protein (putative c-di-GMP-specific phosphodiesterase class I)